jgi:ferredoxin
MLLAEQLQTLKTNGPVPQGMVAGTIQSNGTCTACGACVTVCSTGALALAGEEMRTLTFTPALCVDCGACAKVCLLNFLRPSTPSLESITTLPTTLFQGTMGVCKRCRARTAVLDENNHCPVCAHKARLMDNLI